MHEDGHDTMYGASGYEKRPIGRGGYAVIDVETTGLALTSRVVEVACVLLSEDGAVAGEYETLVDPGGGSGATRIHGIDAAMLRGAPRFEDIANDLVEMLVGRTIVGHGLMFDWTILRGEYRRLRIDLPASPRGICTAAIAQQMFSESARLVDLCRRYGIEHNRPHTAAGDAHATADLLRRFRGHLDVVAVPAPLTPIDRLWRLKPSVPSVSRDGVVTGGVL